MGVNENTVGAMEELVLGVEEEDLHMGYQEVMKKLELGKKGDFENGLMPEEVIKDQQLHLQ